MKKLVAVVTVALALLGSLAYAAEKDAVGRAEDAAKAWLALNDSAQYARSWDDAASIFKASISKADWENTCRSVRSPLGAVRSRILESATFTRTLPGAPDGEYVVIQYDTEFENKAGAVETITPMHEKDGSWRVAGYYIRER
jgi:hypothetical protein